ncbi:AlkZ family DNA glycosylase [Blastococcus sp. TML/M2B]|uniref:winged helix DNA-binding domain-containing protein n=1 Tax=unclassified Blastococcus TaxID=2619396 RepID=UPI00190CF676|nr:MULTISPECIES: winged helix DNA-binding domain-containing protein [unclassified Blastococcus]MBN1091890.1 AlkZ family DNA glycosylase [Blastococcus sp. TML/M2B]MBN1098005.1 AlkZ family DNA glycosylase [Blastococcus sp. TML/C7B]
MTTTPSEIGLLRLVAQRLAGPRAEGPVGAVRRLLAAQGQDQPGALTSVALRTAERSRAAVVAALDRGEIVRSWPMRGTLHLTAAEDLHWMLELMGGRALAGAAKRRAGLGLGDDDAARACEAVVAALSGGMRLSRAELLAAIDAAGVAVTGQRGYHLLWYAAQCGHGVLGPTVDGEQQFVLLDEWVPEPRRLEREEALAELAGRFFAGHGPATVHDLARWSGLTVRDARAGLAAARADLEATTVDGTEYFLDPATPELLAAHREEALGTLLLPGFDEFVLGYRDRSAVLDAEFATRVVPGGNGMFLSTVVVGGRIVGTWRFEGRGAKRAAVGTAFRPADDELVAGVPELAAALP